MIAWDFTREAAAMIGVVVLVAFIKFCQHEWNEHKAHKARMARMKFRVSQPRIEDPGFMFIDEPCSPAIMDVIKKSMIDNKPGNTSGNKK